MLRVSDALTIASRIVHECNRLQLAVENQDRVIKESSELLIKINRDFLYKVLGLEVITNLNRVYMCIPSLKHRPMLDTVCCCVFTA